MSRSSAPRSLVLIAACLCAAALIGGVWAAAAQDAPAEPLTGEVTYTVQPGDVLDLIAAAFDVQTACLAALNDLSSPALIFPETDLLISPECPPYDGASPVGQPRFPLGQGGGAGDQVIFVRPGDTLDTLGQRYNVSVAALQFVNQLPVGAVLISGQQLIIPADAPPYGFFPALLPPPVDDIGGGEAGTLYVIQPRDIVDLIAAYFNVDLACLVERNALPNPALVRPGLTLLIPADCPAYRGGSSRLPGALGGLSITAVPLSGNQQGGAIAATPTPTVAVVEATPTPPPTLAPVTATTVPATRPPTRTPTMAATTVPPVAPATFAPAQPSPTPESLGGSTQQRPPTVTPTPTVSG